MLLITFSLAIATARATECLGWRDGQSSIQWDCCNEDNECSADEGNCVMDADCSSNYCAIGLTPGYPSDFGVCRDQSERGNHEQFLTYVDVDRDTTLRDRGRYAFNAAFEACPWVVYKRSGAVHSVYVRTSGVPQGFDAYALFTNTWRSQDNVLGTNFEIYSTLSDAQSDSNKWTYCNYDDADVGYPRDCGRSGSQAWEWFSMPGGRLTMSFAASFELYTGSNCPVNPIRAQLAACQPVLQNWDCCTVEEPCYSAGLGDCDKDEECAGDLICSHNVGPLYGSGISMNLDVCEEPHVSCDAHFNDWHCCSSTNQCTEGEGDCDFDSDCAGDLTCGRDNGVQYGATDSMFDVCVCELPGTCDIGRRTEASDGDGIQQPAGEEAVVSPLAARLLNGEVAAPL